jgi:YD repeat-containing protein
MEPKYNSLAQVKNTCAIRGNKVHFILLITIYLVSNSQIFAQPFGTPDIPRDHRQTVNSPNVWAFTQYLEHPVDFYTGLPIIEVPLYEIKTGNLSFPIKLSYHASGIRVEQMASNVGLGWKISTNNAITRMVKGFPDDLKEKQYRDHNGNVGISDNAGYLYGGYNHEFDEIAIGKYDAIPDMFFFSCGKYEGTFFLSEDGNPQLVPQQDVLIKMVRSNGNTGEITGFTVVTPDGTIYDYKDIERCYQASASFLVHGISADHWSQGNFHGPFFGCISGPNYAPTLAYYKPRDKSYNSSWFLSSITSAKGDIIQFEYEKEHQLIRNYGGANNDQIQSLGMVYYPVDYYYGYFRTAHSSYFVTQRLSKILFNNAEINFDYKIREDTEYDASYHPHYNYALNKIEVKNAYTNAVLKNIELVTSYFISPDPNISGHTEQTINNTYPTLDAVLSKRLKLEQVLVKDESDEIPYRFDYYEDNTFPSRISDEKDLWGFYNNNNETGIVPEFYEYPGDPYGNNQYYTSPYSLFKRENYEGEEKYYDGANRMSNPNTITSLSLKSIHYPTGGLTNYEYEMHEFYIKGEKKEGGGIRIGKIIKSTDAIVGNNDDIVYRYDYHNSGRIVYELFISKFKTVYEKFPEVGHARYSEPEGGISSSKSSFVTYSRISEILEDTETEYIYDHSAMLGTIHDDYSTDKQEYIFLRPNTYGVGTETHIGYGNTDIYDNSPLIAREHKCPYYPNYDWKRALVKEINYYKNYNSSKTPIKKINKSYHINDYIKIPFKWTVLEQKSGTVLFPDDFLTGVTWSDQYAYSEGFFLSPWVAPSETIETIYNTDGSSISKTITFEYKGTNHKNITRKIEEQSDGVDIIIDYNYTGYTYDISNKVYGYPACEIAKAACINSVYDDFYDCISVCLQYEDDWMCYEQICKGIIELGISNCESTYRICLANSNKELVSEDLLPVTIFYLTEMETFKGQKQIDGEQILYGYAKDGEIHTDSWDLVPTNPLIIPKAILKWEQSDSYKTQVTYDSYDNLGNPLQITDNKTGITTSYIWGYEREYPLAKIVNATYLEIEAVVGSTDLGFLNAGYTFDYDVVNDVKYVEHIYSDEETRNLLAPLRTSLPNAQVTTYTYKPLVGITSETDPNGITTFYDYDNFNRLKTIKDYEGNIVSQYEYNYKNQ